MATGNNDITNFSQDREPARVSISFSNTALTTNKDRRHADTKGLADDVRHLKEINEILDAKNNSLRAFNAIQTQELDSQAYIITTKRDQECKMRDEIEDQRSKIISQAKLIIEKEREIADVRRDLKANQECVEQLEKRFNETEKETKTLKEEIAAFKLKAAALEIELEKTENILKIEKQTSNDDIAILKKGQIEQGQKLDEILEMTRKLFTERTSDVSDDSGYLKVAGSEIPKEVSTEDHQLRRSSKPAVVEGGQHMDWKYTNRIPESSDKSIGMPLGSIPSKSQGRKYPPSLNSKDTLPSIRKSKH